MRLLMALLLVSVASPAYADQKSAEEEILLTVHGTETVTWQPETVRLDVISVPADYELFAEVTCSLTKKHSVEGIKTAVIYDLATPDADPLATWDCSKVPSAQPAGQAQ